MVAMTVAHFDVFEDVKKSREFGIPEALAEYQAKQIEKVFESAVNIAREEVHSKELATKTDLTASIKEVKLKIEQLRTQLEQTKTQLILWVVGIMATFGVFFLGVLAKGFHWI